MNMSMRFAFFLCLLAFVSPYAHATPLGGEAKTKIQVTELVDLKFKADSFFGDRKDMTFTEAPAEARFSIWAKDAIDKVNHLLASDLHVPFVKIKLIFRASITSSSGDTKIVPISMIESYQEPKTSSLRLGMAELNDSEESFKLTVAHEYAHLVLENASRMAGSTPLDADRISFWPQSIYEGLADFLMSSAMNSDFTADKNCWGARDLKEFKSLEQARETQYSIVDRARRAFEKMGLIPHHPIYEDWLIKVDAYIKSIGGVDPYAEGIWLAGSLRTHATDDEKRQALVRLLTDSAKAGSPVRDIQAFHDDLTSRL